MSYSTSDGERKYHSSSLELAACKWVLDEFDKYIYGQPIVLRTDSQAVRDMLRSDSSPSGYKAPWKKAIINGHCHGIGTHARSYRHRRRWFSRSAAHGQYPADFPMAPKWESSTGITNNLYEVPVHRLIHPNADVFPIYRLTQPETDVLLQRFKGDRLENIVKMLTNNAPLDERTAPQHRRPAGRRTHVLHRRWPAKQADRR